MGEINACGRGLLNQITSFRPPVLMFYSISLTHTPTLRPFQPLEGEQSCHIGERALVQSDLGQAPVLSEMCGFSLLAIVLATRRCSLGTLVLYLKNSDSSFVFLKVPIPNTA